MALKYKFPTPPDFHSGATGPGVPLRIAEFEVLSTDGSGVCLKIGYADGAGLASAKLAMSLPAAVKLSEILSDAVDDYVYGSDEEWD